MNPLLTRLHPYPFERLRALNEGIVPNPAFTPIGLGIGEPKHPTPEFIKQAFVDNLQGLASYPGTAGEPALRQAMSDWVFRRYAVKVDPATQILPVGGSREALFAFAQTVVDPTRAGAAVVCPNPFYQIYEGAALLAGAAVAFVNSEPGAKLRGRLGQAVARFAPGRDTQLLYVCSPGNPTGAVMPLGRMAASVRTERPARLRHRLRRMLFGDLFRRRTPARFARSGDRGSAGATSRRLIAFTSLSKRSNVPGMRSGFVAGDAELDEAQFLRYRTYHGSAMSAGGAGRVSIAGLVRRGPRDRRTARSYRAKFAQVTPILRVGSRRRPAGCRLLPLGRRLEIRTRQR